MRVRCRKRHKKSKLSVMHHAVFMLQMALYAIMKDDVCRCGSPPYDNGNPCSVCFAFRTLYDMNALDEKLQWTPKQFFALVEAGKSPYRDNNIVEEIF